MRKLSPILVLVLIWQLVPGAREFVESAVHLVRDGSVYHAHPDAERTPQGSEHGYSGTFHVCPCHSTIAFTTATVKSDVVAAVRVEHDARWWRDSALAEGHLAGVFRPPIV